MYLDLSPYQYVDASKIDRKLLQPCYLPKRPSLKQSYNLHVATKGRLGCSRRTRKLINGSPVATSVLTFISIWIVAACFGAYAMIGAPLLLICCIMALALPNRPDALNRLRHYLKQGRPLDTPALEALYEACWPNPSTFATRHIDVDLAEEDAADTLFRRVLGDERLVNSYLEKSSKLVELIEYPGAEDATNDTRRDGLKRKLQLMAADTVAAHQRELAAERFVADEAKRLAAIGAEQRRVIEANQRQRADATWQAEADIILSSPDV